MPYGTGHHIHTGAVWKLQTFRWLTTGSRAEGMWNIATDFKEGGYYKVFITITQSVSKRIWLPCPYKTAAAYSIWRALRDLVKSCLSATDWTREVQLPAASGPTHWHGNILHYGLPKLIQSWHLNSTWGILQVHVTTQKQDCVLTYAAAWPSIVHAALQIPSDAVRSLGLTDSVATVTDSKWPLTLDSLRLVLRRQLVTATLQFGVGADVAAGDAGVPCWKKTKNIYEHRLTVLPALQCIGTLFTLFHTKLWTPALRTGAERHGSY
jgi:hypothetical protein